MWQDFSVLLRIVVLSHEKYENDALPECTSLKFDYRPKDGFDLDLGIFGPVSSSAEMDTNSRKWS